MFYNVGFWNLGLNWSLWLEVWYNGNMLVKLHCIVSN